MENLDAGVDKDAYFEICREMGSEPVESEIPLDIDDFPEFVAQVIQMYYMLRDIWDPMSATYMGKDLGIIFRFFDLYELDKEEQKLAITYIGYLDNVRRSILSRNREAKEAVTKPPTNSR